MKKISKLQWCIWGLAVAPLAATALLYGRLPEQVAMHWNLDGSVNYGHKAQLFMIAGMAPLLAALFYAVPYIDPKKRSYEKFSGSYKVFQLFLMVFLLLVTGIILVEGLRPGTLRVEKCVIALVAALFIVIGNMMPKFRQNFFCGIKTPWALSSEKVWNRTHRLGGRLMFAAGILGLVSVFLPSAAAFTVVLGSVLVAVAVPSVMSYFWYQRESNG